MFPWKLMPSTLADNNVCIKGYPAHNCVLPGETHGVTSQSKSKGIASLTQKEVTILVEALKVKTMYVEKVSIMKRAAVSASEIPVIIGEAPPSDYPHAGARRLFIDGHMDYNGPPRLKASAATMKVKKSATSAGKSSMHPEVLIPPPSRPFKIVPRPPAREVIEVRSTSSDSQDEHGRPEPASESEYEDASHGKRKRWKPSGELLASEKSTSPVDLLPKAVKTDSKPSKEKIGPSSQGPIASPSKGSSSSPLTVESSGNERDAPAGTNTNNAKRLRDGPSNKAEDTKGHTKAQLAKKGSHPKGRLGWALRAIYSDAESDGESIKLPSPKPTPVNIEDSAVSSRVDTPAETTEAPVQLPSSNTETNSARTLPPCEGDAVGDIGQVAAALQQLGGSSATELPPLPQRGGGGGDESILKTCLQILTTNVRSLRTLKIPSITKYMILMNLSIKYLANPTVKFLVNPSIKIFGIISIRIEGIILSTTLVGLLTLMVLSFLTLVNALIERCMILTCLVVIPMTHPIIMSSQLQDYQHLRPHNVYYHRNGNGYESPPEHYDTCNPTRDLSPVAESSMDYSMERERSRSQAYHDRYGPAVDHGYTRREYGPPRGDFDDRGHRFPPQHSRGHYHDPHTHGRRLGYNADSRWASHDSRSPYYGPSPNSNSQAEYPDKVPPSA
ncbi:uncharacterized protein EDB91DRAFT_1255335 [Suillus paluster]|uniref:uncharacterized protein n=1 Tax=Suillus paluster TaxID=48578 RepID=UPI001B87DEFE|nr:uncharacterized protein EDB91DRAFT_1255335 [Suillus paluster]KAG1724199.1 hypothetical protein EDB91DRAFT_1255335 [Suillus paluster]